MKTIVTGFLLIVSLAAHSQKAQRTMDQLPTYQGIIEVPGKDPVQLYGLLKEWTAKAYNSAKDVIQLDDEVNGKLILKGVEHYTVRARNVLVPNNCLHTITLEIKPGKFRYTIEVTEVETGTMNLPIMDHILLQDVPLNAEGRPYTGASMKNALSMKDQHLSWISDFKESLIKSLEDVATQKTDDW